MLPRLLFLMFALAWACTMPCCQAAAPPLRVLFLGDQGHHNPADRAAQLVPTLAGRGIDVTYTNDVGSLNADFLSRFDALVLYANIERITPEQEAGLLSYVEQGGGFVPLHCASFCFQNSPKFIALVGGQFKSHGTGEFETKVVAPNHPIMQGFEPFETWDETYVHGKHNEADRTVLQVRSEGEQQEPWTWVRTQGKGRVFYTAYGHDARTWMNPGFQALVERGIRWAAGRGPVFDSIARPQETLKPFAYAEALLPNYVEGGKWGTLGEPIRTMQQPVDPRQSQQHLVVPPGFIASLFTSEPDVAKPICLDWDHRGRLWVAETFDYPNDMQRQGAGHDRITICEDTNGDGQADKFTVFADKLSIPTSLTFAFGGVLVHQAPDTLFLKDTNGDDKADVRETLFSGWATNDTHAGPSNLRYGLDGWYYGMVGYAGFRGNIAGTPQQFRQGFYRFQLTGDGQGLPHVSRFEFLRNVNNNAWGVGFSEEGLVFGSTANGCPSVFLSIPNRFYESVKGWTPAVLESISPSNRFFPITRRVRQVDHHGGFTSAAGHSLYTARNYPSNYWNKTAFVSDPTGHLIATFVLEPQGSNFAAYNSWNLVASDDEWTAPISAEVGPDGNLWVIDWYNYVVQHNPTPNGFETGKGNAYVTPLRDKRHGRIYRILHEQNAGEPAPQLNVNDTKGLIAALSHSNMFWRLTAQRLLIERGQQDVVPALLALARQPMQDETGLSAGSTHALWTIHALTSGRQQVSQTGPANSSNILESDRQAAFTAALKHPSAAVRRAAVMTLPRTATGTADLLAANVLHDREPQVRLAALLSLSELPASAQAGQALASLLSDSATMNDRWLPDALTAAAANNATEFLVAAANVQPSAPASTVISRVAEHLARGESRRSLSRILTALSTGKPEFANAVLKGWGTGWPQQGQVALDASAEIAFGRLLQRLDAGGRGQLVNLANRWGMRGLDQYLDELNVAFLATASDATQKEAERVEAVNRLIQLQPANPRSATAVAELITPQLSPSLTTRFIEALSSSTAPETGTKLIDRFGVVTPVAQQAILKTVLSRSEWTNSLMQALAIGRLRFSDLTLDQQQRLISHPDASIARQAKELLAKGGGLPNADRQKVIEEMTSLVLTGGDTAHGKLVFTQQCAKCHKHSGEGSPIGPDLTGMAAHTRDELLIHILDPSRSVEGNFRQYTVVTIDGLVKTGLLGSETKTSIELIDSEAKRHPVLREEIEELIVSPKSLMPEGFEKPVPPADMRDLLAFLTQRGKFLPLDLRKVASITSVEGMFYAKDQAMERLVFESWEPKEFAGVPFLLVDPREGRERNVVLLRGPQGTFPPTMPDAVHLPCHTPAKAIHLLGGVAGWAWPGGQKGSVSMIVRLHYEDHQTEDHTLRNGIEIADYIREVDVPGSKLAFNLSGRQVRYLAVVPKRPAEIAEIELVKGSDTTAPLVVAITVETK